MKLILPCKFGEVFTTLPNRSGQTYEYKLVGYNNGMKWHDQYDPSLNGVKVSDLSKSIVFLDSVYIPPVFEIDVPDRFIEPHSLSEHQSTRKADVYFWGTSLDETGILRFDFIFPKERYRHEYIKSQPLTELFAGYVLEGR